MEIHRKEVKFKEVVRLRGLYSILTIERGFWLQGNMHCGEVTRKSVEELMEG